MKEGDLIRKGSIYIIKNKCNDKVYIGQTIQDVEERFKQHLRPSIMKQRGTYKIYNAMNKYGKENFYHETLEVEVTQDLLDEREIYYIDLFDSYKNGYNSTYGGNSRRINKIEDVDKLIEMFKKGYTYEEMGDYFGVHKETTKRILRPLGFTRSNDPKISKEDLLKHKDLYNYEIAEIFNVDGRTVSRSFKRFGISRGRGCNNYKNKQNQKNVTTRELSHRVDDKLPLEVPSNSGF